MQVGRLPLLFPPSMARLHLCLLLVALVAFSVRAQAIAPLAGLRPLAVVAPVFDSDAPSRGPLAAQHHADAAQGRRGTSRARYFLIFRIMRPARDSRR